MFGNHQFDNQEFSIKIPSRESPAQEKEKGLHLILHLHLKIRLQLKMVSKSTIKRNEHFNIMFLRTAVTPKATQ